MSPLLRYLNAIYQRCQVLERCVLSLDDYGALTYTAPPADAARCRLDRLRQERPAARDEEISGGLEVGYASYPETSRH
jgi:hypothetical protein